MVLFQDNLDLGYETGRIFSGSMLWRKFLSPSLGFICIDRFRHRAVFFSGTGMSNRPGSRDFVPQGQSLRTHRSGLYFHVQDVRVRRLLDRQLPLHDRVTPMKLHRAMTSAANLKIHI
jgi:hypothetical protein